MSCLSNTDRRAVAIGVSNTPAVWPVFSHRLLRGCGTCAVPMTARTFSICKISGNSYEICDRNDIVVNVGMLRPATSKRRQFPGWRPEDLKNDESYQDGDSDVHDTCDCRFFWKMPRKGRGGHLGPGLGNQEPGSYIGLYKGIYGS